VGDVGAQQLTGEIDQAGVTSPPGKTGGFLVFAPDATIKELLESVTTGQYLFREYKLFVGLVGRCHPGPDTFVQQNVLRVEGLKFGVFSGADFLRHEVVGPQVQTQTDDADAAHPQTQSPAQTA
jgi:hypothetical protein